MHAYNEHTDEQLLALSAAGDENAFELLVHRCEERIVNLAYRYVGNRDAAEDIAAEVFLKAWQNAARFKGESGFFTWLYRIAVNTCLNRQKKARSIPFLDSIDRLFSGEEGEYAPEIPDTADPEPPVRLQDRERASAVQASVEALPPQQKMAFILSWFEERSYREIAEIMELSVPAVESLLYRAKENLRKTLSPVKDSL